jgi:hypothetical protein
MDDIPVIRSGDEHLRIEKVVVKLVIGRHAAGSPDRYQGSPDLVAEQIPVG